MSNHPRVYLDNAATSWPKPPEVVEAVVRYMTDCGAAAGRGSYSSAMESGHIVSDCRRRLVSLFGLRQDSDRMIFTLNGTDSLNLAIHGLVRAGDHVVTTVAEHNSVLRPLAFLSERAGVETTYVSCNSAGIVDPDEFRRAVRRNTRLIIATHASNVTGAIQPIEEIGRIAKEHGAYFAIDAAQTAGHLPIDLSMLDCDLLATPGHKGLLGPLGLGVLYVGPSVQNELIPTRQGGTGTNSEEERQPSDLPERFESGNLNVPAIAGLRAALTYIEQRDLGTIRQHELQLTQTLLDGLVDVSGVRLFGPRDANQRVGVVSIAIGNMPPQEIGALLDASYSVQTRSGLHCAPRMHRSMGTATAGGTVRLSIGPFTTMSEIQVVVSALREIAAECGGE